VTAFKNALSRGLGRVYDAAGDAATYTDRNSVQTPCTVLVEQDLSRYGESAQVNVRTAVLSVRVSEVANAPRRGDTFAIAGGATYKVDSLQGSDGVEHKVFVA